MEKRRALDRAKQLLILGGALLPILYFIHLFVSHRLPVEALKQSINLSGPWKVLSGATVGGELAALNDSDAREMTVPGGYWVQGFRDKEIWLRRRFQAPSTLLGKPLYLTMEDLRTGTASLYLNGRYLGQVESALPGSKAEASGLEGWDVPANLLQPGENLLAVRFSWGWLGADGIMGNPPRLGPAELLKKPYEDIQDARRLLQHEAAAVMLLLVVLFTALAMAEWETANRRLYLSCLTLLIAATVFLVLRTRALVITDLPSWAMGPALYLSVLGLFYAWPDFVARYLGFARFRKFNARVCGVFLALLLSMFVLGQEAAMSGTFLVLSVYGLIPVLYLTAATLMRQLRTGIGVGTVLASGVFSTAITGTVDLLANLGLLATFPMFPLGISACAITAAVVLIADFTQVSYDNKALSQSLKRTNVDLEEALVRSQEATRLKSEFLATMSHELRTPLNSVLNVPEGLIGQFAPVTLVRCRECAAGFELEAGESIDSSRACPACRALGTLSPAQDFHFVGQGETAVRGLQQIHRAGTHLLALINDILDFSTLDSGKAKLALEPVDVKPALQRVLDALGPSARAKGIELVLQVPDERQALHVDSAKLIQIVSKLVDNAVKFSPEQAQVRVTAREVAMDWLFSVEDQGIGVAPEHHGLIFESFRQVDGSNTRRFGGTGLGLALTRKLAEAHGGKVWVESAEGKGSTFFVQLPRAGPERREELHSGRA